jgi:hypothetical protein
MPKVQSLTLTSGNLETLPAAFHGNAYDAKDRGTALDVQGRKEMIKDKAMEEGRQEQS